MRNFFNIDNPIWKFIGRIADFFLLTILWIVCSLPIITIGASSTALYYVTLKMAEDKEGKLIDAFFKSFRLNFKQGTILWLCAMIFGAIVVIDHLWILQNGSIFASAMFITLSIVTILYLCILSFLFVVLSRCDNSSIAIFKMTAAMVIRNLLPILAGVIVWAAFIAVGVFVAWPILLITPGMGAYLNSLLYKRIFEKYGMSID